MKKAVFSFILFIVAMSVGCRYCCTPYDNCGPVFANPHNCEWNYRSGSAFNPEAVPAEGQMVDGQVIMDGQMVDGQVITDPAAANGQFITAPGTEGTILDGEVIEAAPIQGETPIQGAAPINQPATGTVIPDGAALPSDGYMVYKKFNGV